MPNVSRDRMQVQLGWEGLHMRTPQHTVVHDSEEVEVCFFRRVHMLDEESDRASQIEH